MILRRCEDGCFSSPRVSASCYELWTFKISTWIGCGGWIVWVSGKQIRLNFYLRSLYLKLPASSPMISWRTTLWQPEAELLWLGCNDEDGSNDVLGVEVVPGCTDLPLQLPGMADSSQLMAACNFTVWMFFSIFSFAKWQWFRSKSMKQSSLKEQILWFLGRS